MCPFCSSQDCLISTSCELSVRCQRSGRDSDNVCIYMPSVRDSVDKTSCEHRFAQLEVTTRVRLAAGPKGLAEHRAPTPQRWAYCRNRKTSFRPHGPVRSRPPLFFGACSPWRRRSRRSTSYPPGDRAPFAAPLASFKDLIVEPMQGPRPPGSSQEGRVGDVIMALPVSPGGVLGELDGGESPTYFPPPRDEGSSTPDEGIMGLPRSHDR